MNQYLDIGIVVSPIRNGLSGISMVFLVIAMKDKDELKSMDMPNYKFPG